MTGDIRFFVEELTRHIATRPRYMLGVTGLPGSGKSTFANKLANAWPGKAAVVAMDGFHLTNAQLDVNGWRSRKGAPYTFDAEAFLLALKKLRQQDALSVPIYDRSIHEPRPCAVQIDPDVQLVIVEGNYLLLEDGAWRGAGGWLDEVWFVDTPFEMCLQRVLHRHIQGGLDETDAKLKIEENDRPNSALVLSTRSRAHQLIKWV